MRKAKRQAFGHRLKVAQSDIGVSTRNLAHALGVKEGLISFWRTGRSLPPPGLRARLANALGVSVHWLLSGDVGTGHEGAKELRLLRVILSDLDASRAEILRDIETLENLQSK